MAHGMCAVDHCQQVGRLRRGWCDWHYTCWRKTGNPVLPGVTGARRRDTECSAAGCDRRGQMRRGLCRRHYRQWRTSTQALGELGEAPPKGTPGAVCIEDGCGSTNRITRGMCWNHYKASLYRNDPQLANARKAWRRGSARQRMTKQDIAISVQYRLAIATDPCFYCGKPGEQVDHYVALAKGGNDHWWNLVRACADCNNRKSARCGTWFTLHNSISAGVAISI